MWIRRDEEKQLVELGRVNTWISLESRRCEFERSYDDAVPGRQSKKRNMEKAHFMSAIFSEFEEMTVIVQLHCKEVEWPLGHNKPLA